MIKKFEIRLISFAPIFYLYIQGDETALEFPDGETPPDVLSLAETPSGKENEEKSKSPVRFIKSSDGTIKISSVISHTSRYFQFQNHLLL